jgi:hypothetical protein
MRGPDALLVAGTAAAAVAVYWYLRRRRAAHVEPFLLLPITSPATVRKMAALPLRESDIFVASYPKSGTTWMQHIVHVLATDGESPLPHVSDACPFYDVDRTWNADVPDAVLADEVQARHARLGRRIFNTHLRWEMMPKSHPDARYIYMVRRPADACVSFFHHLTHQAADDGGFTGTFDQFVDEWTGGRGLFGSWSAHLKSWLGQDGQGAAAADPRVLVISYEELRADLRTQIRRVNEHCRFRLSIERLDALLPRFTFEWMREHEAQFNPRSVSWVPAPAAAFEGSSVVPEAEFHFIRAGRVGDGQAAFMSAERKAAMSAMAERTFIDGIPQYISKLLP